MQSIHHSSARTARILTALLGAAAVATAFPASASDVFVKLNGIVGGSTDAQHPKEIEALSYSQSVQSAATFGYGAAGAGKATCGDITISKLIDVSTPALIMKVLTGTRISDGLITFRRGGKEQQEYYTVELTDVIVVAVEQTEAAASSIGVTEVVKLKARQFRFSYRPQLPDGSLGPVQSFGFDCVSNTRI